MRLLVTPEVAEALYGDNIPPGIIVTVNAPDGWPLELPWPPQVTVPGPPCWGCVTRPVPEWAAVNRYFAEHPLGPVHLS